MENYSIQKLNNAQILPVKDTEGAILVIAGAGSGKTRVLTNRIAYLVMQKNVNPQDILAITFTNKASDEMKQRLEKMIGSLGGMWVSTIHSMCVKILRASIGALGYEKNFSIYSEDDKERVLKRIINDMELEPEKFLKLAKNCISMAKNDGLSPREFKEENIRLKYITEITEIFTKYEKQLKENNALDFDDLLIKTLNLFEENDEVRNYFSHRFRYVHVDEFQDTNTVQYKIIKILASGHKNIFVVGDDDQSIYGWRGAKISNILDFEHDFKGAKVYKLEQNYRSTKNILNVANLIIKNNVARKNKTLWTENDAGSQVELYTANEESDEAQNVALKVKNAINKGAKASDFAVLMRVNALSRSFEQEFLKYNIPYKVFGGFKFFDRKEIKDLTAYLRIIANPLDSEAILRVINVPRRGIGDKSVEAILKKCSIDEMSIYEALLDADSLPLGPSARERIKDFKNIIYNLIMSSANLSVSQIIKEIIEKTNFNSQYEEDTEENHEKLMNIGELINSATEFEKVNKDATLTDYLSSITLSSDTDEMDESNYVSIATVHSVKGLEFNTVFVVGLDETIFPISRSVNSEEELEEERRLMYVAITRAKKQLYLTRARSRYIYGTRNVTSESRFLKEINPLLKCTDNGYNRYSSYGSYGDGYKSRYNSFNKDGNDYGYYADEPSSTSYGKTKFTSSYNVFNAPKKTQNIGKFRVGTKVFHKKFGKGIVIAVKNEGKFVDVSFTSAGIKTLAVEVAPLEIEN
ncbi:MAG: UvrD-helicase domain-containing protein [Clostridia bacterium]|nr:UvrD-helicase domain-containing protein [Clostridia bacterium]